MTPDAMKAAEDAIASKKNNKDTDNDKENKSGIEEEDFFDFITRFQSKRMDDQRCSLTVPGPLSS